MNDRAANDVGLTLIELVVAGVVSLLVLTVLLSVFVSASNTQAATKNRDVAGGTSQVATNSIQVAVRNSSAFTVSGNLLRARVASGNGSDWRCQAWALTPAKLLVTRTSTSAIAVPTDYTGWATLASGVTGGLSSGKVFEAGGTGGGRLNYAFIVTSGTGSTAASVAVSGDVLPQAKGSGSPTSCW